MSLRIQLLELQKSARSPLAPDELQESPSPTSRREHVRYDTDELGILTCMDPCNREKYPIHILNVSRNGLGFAVCCQLAVGTVTQVRLPHLLVLGEVRHCRSSPGGYLAGMQIQDVVTYGAESRTEEA